MLFEKNLRPRFDAAAVIVLCFLFFFCSAGMVLLSGTVYAHTIRTSEENFTRRTTMSYLANQIRLQGLGESVRVLGDFHGTNALVLTERVGDFAYETHLYCYDGYLRELYAEQGTDLRPDSGTELLPLRSFSIELIADGLLLLSIEDEQGLRHTLKIAPRQGVLRG